MSSCFIAYITTPNEQVSLANAVNGCLVYDLGGPMHAGLEFFWLLKRRVLSESLLDACKLLVDSGRDNNGYERLNYDWTVEMIAGEPFHNDCYARYGVDAIHKKIFKFGTRAPQANRYVRFPLNNGWLSRQFDSGPLDFRVRNVPEYSNRQTPFKYISPFHVTSRHDYRIINPERLWLFLADPFRERFHIMKANPLEMKDVQRHPYNFISEWEIDLNYRALHNSDEISLAVDGMGKIQAEGLIFSQVRGFATSLVTGGYNLEMDATQHRFSDEYPERPLFRQYRERPYQVNRSYEIQLPRLDLHTAYPESLPSRSVYQQVEEPERGATEAVYPAWHYDPTEVITDEVPSGTPLIRWNTDYEHQQAEAPVMAMSQEMYERIMNWYRSIIEDRGSEE